MSGKVYIQESGNGAGEVPAVAASETGGHLQVRDAVFETNSSSSHSLTVAAADSLAGTFPKEMLRAGRVQVSVGEFGWEWRRYFEPLGKVRYLVTQITDGEPPQGEDAAEVSARLLDVNEDFRLLAKVVKEQSGCELLVEPSSGYIDHQSSRSEKAIGMELFENPDRLRHFIFSPDSYVETGNDNSPPGWAIQSDLGEQLAYRDRFAQPGPDWVPVKFIRLGGWQGDLATGAGGLLTKESSKLLWAELLRTGVVTSVEWVIADPYLVERNRSWNEKRGAAAHALNYGGYLMGISPDLQVYMSLTPDKTADEQFSFSAMVPPGLAARLLALDSKGHRQYLIKELERWLSYWQGRLKESPRDRWSQKKLAEVEAKLLKLTGNTALEAVKRKAAAGRGKSYARSQKPRAVPTKKSMVRQAKKRACAAKGKSK